MNTMLGDLTEDMIKRQQQVLTFLGYYNGKIDGIWSAKSIEAKLKFERSGKFNPGIPNNGLPFSLRAPLPAGLIFEKGTMLINTTNLDIKELTVEELPVSKSVAFTQPEIVSKATLSNQQSSNKHNQHKPQNQTANQPANRDKDKDTPSIEDDIA
jgi:hypothetical protein